MTNPAMLRCVIICTLAAVACAQVPSVVVEPVNEIFLHCLCDGLVFPCNHNRGCTSTDMSAVCGPFGIVEGYWKDAGSHVVDDNSKNRMKLAYQTCALDLPCAAKTVAGYMSGGRRKDCNRDGVIDGKDYALTHWQGGYLDDCSFEVLKATNSTDGLNFIKRFDECMTRFSLAYEPIAYL